MTEVECFFLPTVGENSGECKSQRSQNVHTDFGAVDGSDKILPIRLAFYHHPPPNIRL